MSAPVEVRGSLDELAVARELIAAGVPVFVAPPRRDYPKGDPRNEFNLPQEWQRTVPDPTALDAWRPGWAVCVLTGHGVDGIDVDPKHGANVEEMRQRLAALGVCVLAEVVTPTGGAHFYVRSTGLSCKASQRAGVDYRGTNGFLYAPGTSRPKYNGKGYAWRTAPDPADLADLAQRDEDDADAVETFLAGLGINVTGPGVEGVAVVAAQPCGQLPDWLRDELADLGHLVPVAGLRGEVNPRLRWAAAGGGSYSRSERFYRLTAACRRAGLDQGQAVGVLTPWCAAVGKYTGREAVEVARIWEKVAPDAGAGVSRRGAPLHVVEGGVSAGASREAVPVGAEPVPWDEPIPTMPAMPGPVPIDGLPDWLRDMVAAVEVQSQAPREVVLAAALGTLAAATRGAWDVHPWDGWNAGPTALWLCALASSGERKGAGTAPLVEPLQDAERALAAEVRLTNRNRENERKRLEAQLKEAQHDDDPERVARLQAAVHEVRARCVPGLVVSDATTEALGMYMTEQGGAVAIFGTEASSFQTVAGQYSDKSGGNFGLLNNAYDAEQYSDRRIRRDGIRLDRPTLSWCAAVQPEVMGGYATVHAEGSGFLNRFALFVATSKIGSRQYRTEPVPAHVAVTWAAVVTSLHRRAWQLYADMVDELPDRLGKPARVTFRDDAADMLADYAEAVERDLKGRLAGVSAWGSKAAQRVARIAAILALAEDPGRLSVEPSHVRAALSIAEPMTAHAVAGFAVMRQAANVEPVERLREALQRHGQPVVTTREAHRLVHGQGWAVNTAATREVLLALADDHGYVRLLDDRQPGRGRPAERWEVHPDLTR